MAVSTSKRVFGGQAADNWTSASPSVMTPTPLSDHAFWKRPGACVRHHLLAHSPGSAAGIAREACAFSGSSTGWSAFEAVKRGSLLSQDECLLARRVW